MCLLIQGSRRVAKENIVCYKVLKECFEEGRATPSHIRSALFTHEWKLGKEYEAPRARWRPIYDSIFDGYFHSYKTLKDAFTDWHLQKPSDFNYRHIIYKCLIPKGSTYYYGIHDGGVEGYASKRMMVVGYVNDDLPFGFATNL